VLIDSSAFFATASSSGNHHREALAIQQRILRERLAALATNFVVAETHALMLTRVGRYHARRWLDGIDDLVSKNHLSIIRIEPEDEVRARQIIRQYNDKDFSLVDASSFAVMERLGIHYAFTFDRHFEQYGLAVLAP
jgi:predicted nucleic acid-binding protein